MRLHFSERSIKSYESAPTHILRAFDAKLELLLKNLRHPSLRAKKYDEAHDVWQARINRDWRFYFSIDNDTYHIVDMTPRELATLAPLAILTIFFGVYPSPILDIFGTTVENLMKTVQTAAAAAQHIATASLQ